MNIRPDIAELLREGLSNRAIAAELHVDAKQVAAARTALGLPRAKSGIKAAESPEALFHQRTKAHGGHLLWTGYTVDGLPALRHDGRLLSANRIAFRIQTGREPVGNATPGCGRPGCVAPGHMDDRPTRERNRTAYTALFGGS